MDSSESRGDDEFGEEMGGEERTRREDKENECRRMSMSMCNSESDCSVIFCRPLIQRLSISVSSLSEPGEDNNKLPRVVGCGVRGILGTTELIYIEHDALNLGLRTRTYYHLWSGVSTMVCVWRRRGKLAARAGSLRVHSRGFDSAL